MMEVIGQAPRGGGGTSVSSPAADVKRTASESPYTSAVATTFLRGLIARGVTTVFQLIVCLRPLLGTVRF
jgi:hypothetical protein